MCYMETGSRRQLGHWSSYHFRCTFLLPHTSSDTDTLVPSEQQMSQEPSTDQPTEPRSSLRVKYKLSDKTAVTEYNMEVRRATARETTQIGWTSV